MIPLAKNIKRKLSLKEAIVVVLAVIIAISAGVGVFLSSKREVVIHENGKSLTVKTMKSTVKEVLEQNGIALDAYDYVSMPLGERLHRIKTNDIIIERAVPVNVFADGREIKLMTWRDNIADALSDSHIELTDTDRIEGAESGGKIEKDMNIKIVRVREELITENESIPFNTQSRENSHLDEGVQQVLREGSEGLLAKDYKTIYEDGKQVLKEMVKETVVMNPIDKVIEFGTVLNHMTARGNKLRYSNVLDMRSTAYTASYADTGKHPGDPLFGITATGVQVHKGVIAVDPRVIPLGTRVYVEVEGNAPDYGYAIAADTGSAIKGNIIDLYYDDGSYALNWGVKKVKVYILVE